MESPDDARVERIANEIVCYIRRNLRSKDSLDGIRTCWLSTEHVDAPRAAVKSAIDRLIERKVLMHEVLPDGGVIYGAARPQSGRQR